MGAASARAVLALLSLFVTLSVTASAPPAARGDDVELVDGVFQLLIVARDGRFVSSGTAFFVDAKGTALTNSHVVYRAFHDPDHFLLLAVVAKEFYSASITCASQIGTDPTLTDRGPLDRDVAEIQLAPSTFPYQMIRLPGHIDLVSATAHTTELPAFPALTFGDDPREGQQVRVVGFGLTSEVPEEEWGTTGTVMFASNAIDGTPIFQIQSVKRPRPGNSGSPVLDDQNHVVGMYTWNMITNDQLGFAISSSALIHPCP